MLFTNADALGIRRHVFCCYGDVGAMLTLCTMAKWTQNQSLSARCNLYLVYGFGEPIFNHIHSPYSNAKEGSESIPSSRDVIEFVLWVVRGGNFQGKITMPPLSLHSDQRMEKGRGCDAKHGTLTNYARLRLCVANNTIIA